MFSDPNVISQHVGLLTYILPTAALDLLAEQLVRIAERSTGSLGLTSMISLLIAPWSSNSGVSALFDALNVIYREREDRTLVRFYATAFLNTLGGAAFLLLTISVVILPAIMEHVGVGDWPTRSCPSRGGRSSWSW
ncbi:YhjD/YihY/BrkB family envelope integrity protein [Methylobacterium sp. CM6247]